MATVTRVFPENERKILTLISRVGPCTKRQLAARGPMAWATVVKLINRLETEGFVVKAGFDVKSKVKGKDSVLYDLNERFPLAIGIDVEYTVTRVALTNLRGEVLASHTTVTPRFDSADSVARYCLDLCRTFAESNGVSRRSVIGIGVAVPLFLVDGDKALFTNLQSILSSMSRMPIVVDDVSRVYALYKRHELHGRGDFAVVTIRSGIGLGLLIGGRLYRGEDNLAGQLGHLVVDPNHDEVCGRCGRLGCLEMLVNERLLALDVLNGEEALPERTNAGYHESIVEDIRRLLTKADAGDTDARSRVDRRAAYLALGIASVTTLFNIRRVYVAAHFGELGETFVGPLRDALERFTPGLVPLAISYEELRDEKFTLGAAFVVLGDYCNYEID